MAEQQLLTCECGSTWWRFSEEVQVSVSAARGAESHGGSLRAPVEARRLRRLCAGCGSPAPSLVTPDAPTQEVGE